MGPATIISDVTPNSVVRRRDLIKRVASGIKSAKVQVFDGSIVFDGQLKKELVLTAAFAESVVDNKIQAALFVKGSDQVNVVFKMNTPKVVPLNFEEALKNEIKVTYEADIKLGNSENVLIKGFGERSKVYTEQLKNDPLGKKCLHEISQNNFHQMDCYKMIIKAHAPDTFTATFTYKDLNPAILTGPFKGSNLYKHLTVGKEQNLTHSDKAGTVEIKVQASYYDNLINYLVKTEYGTFHFTKGGQSYYPYEMSFYAPNIDWEYIYDWYRGYQFMREYFSNLIV